MKRRFDVLLNDVSLLSLNDGIYITDISYPAPSISYNVAHYAGRNGGLVTGKRKEETSVQVTFELHIYGTQQRQQACWDIINWAINGGKLQTSDRIDQYLQCVCTKLPTIESAMKWTDRLTAEFTAYAIPYWQSVIPVKFTIDSADEDMTMFVPGNATALADVTVTAGEAITSLTVEFGDSSITLSGISVAQNGTVVFSHDENGILSIKTGTTSLLDKRTAASSDDLTAECGTIQISVTGSGAVEAEFRVKGVWN